MNKRFTFQALLIALLLIISGCHAVLAQSHSPKPRTIVTTDGEVDDQDSFIRMLLYSNEFSLIGLVYTGSHRELGVQVPVAMAPHS